MTSCLAPEKRRTQNVGMGQILVARAPARLVAVLGSCVGIALWHPQQKIAALAHVVLPDSSGREARPGKFANTAVPAMIRQLRSQGLRPEDLVAKIAGGASMFGGPGPMRIGPANVDAVRHALAEAGIPLVGQDVGGRTGRRVVLHAANGQLVVQTAGAQTAVL